MEYVEKKNHKININEKFFKLIKNQEKKLKPNNLFINIKSVNLVKH